MKNVSNDYKNAIKTNGRELDVRIYDGYGRLTLNDIYGCRLIVNGAILKTLMKEFTLDTKQILDPQNNLNFQLGIKVNNSFEYVDFGDFIINNVDYKEDTKRYTYTCYDKMLLTMVKFNDTNTYPISLYNFTNAILNDLGFTLTNQTLPNGTRTFSSNPFEGYNYTYRDVLDCICEVVGASAIVNGNNFTFITPTQTNEVISADYLNEDNVKFGETFGPINSILFTRFEDADYIEIKDDSSIAQYGKTQISIKNNPILNNDDRATYQSELFAVLNGLSYNINDYSSIGITYLDFMDIYQVVRGNNTYDCLLLNDEITIVGGISENIYTDKPQEYQSEYKTSTETTEDVSARVDKANKEIVLKVDSNGKLVQQRLGLDANGGSVFNVKADNIKLEGYTTINGTFTIDNNGNMSCSNATITGGRVSIPSGYGMTADISPQGIMVYKTNDPSTQYAFLSTFQEGQLKYGYFTLSMEGSTGVTLTGYGSIECNQLIANNIKCGQSYTNGGNDTWVSFGHTFSSVPYVVCTPVMQTAGVGNYSLNVWGITTTGFYVYHSGGNSAYVTFNWIAMV